jgi:small neutral amino acid transporter SnatA (MarC family)
VALVVVGAVVLLVLMTMIATTRMIGLLGRKTTSVVKRVLEDMMQSSVSLLWDR